MNQFAVQVRARAHTLGVHSEPGAHGTLASPPAAIWRWTGRRPTWENKITAPSIRARRVATPLVMLTAYDAPGARMADEAGVDVILVGDSLAMVVLGYDDTLQVTIDDMAHHTGAVARAEAAPAHRRRPALDELPRVGRGHRAQRGRAGPGRRAGREARRRPEARRDGRAIVDAEIPVMGHVGLTPQSVHAMGGFKVQGQAARRGRALVDDARALEEAGCFAIVLEGVPDVVARMVTDAVSVPTIGIGAGPYCDGQVLVFYDLLGIEDRIAEVRAPLRRAQGRCRRRRAPSPPTCARRFPPRRELSPVGRGGRCLGALRSATIS